MTKRKEGLPHTEADPTIPLRVSRGSFLPIGQRTVLFELSLSKSFREFRLFFLLSSRVRLIQRRRK